MQFFRYINMLSKSLADTRRLTSRTDSHIATCQSVSHNATFAHSINYMYM